MASQSTTLPHRPTTKFVGDAQSLQYFISELEDLTISHPAKILFLDLEGINLSRHGSISLLTLLIHDISTQAPHPDQLYLIDIHTLGSSTFTTPSNQQSSTLKHILESPVICKVLFDVRNDSDALFAHFGIHLQGTIDLQLMENLSRPGRNKRLVHGLGRCIKSDSSLSFNDKLIWEATKEAGLTLFAPEKGGRYEVFNDRPLRQEISEYCTQDVWCMPGIYHVYQARLESSGVWDWEVRVGRETENRLVNSRSQGYQPHGRDKALAPKWDAVLV